MKFFLTPRRHAVVLPPGQRPMTPEEKLAEITDARRDMVVGLKNHFPRVQVLGIADSGTILIELPDDEPDLRDRICAELDCVTGRVPGDGPPEPDHREDVPPTLEAVAEAHRTKEYQPVIVALIRDERGRILFVQSVFNPADWMFVQSGIKEDESPIVALTRCLREKVGMGPRRTRLRPPRYVYTVDLDVEKDRVGELVFTKGKRYFIYEVMYQGPERISIQQSEMASYEWLPANFSHPRLRKIIADLSTGKSHLIIGSIADIL